jgi:F-type H+-transporting ATPase subunit epsilon
MRLVVSTPLAVVVDAANVVHVRAEDDTGAFGIQPRHALFVTALCVSVVTWREADGSLHHVAVRRGILMVRDGETVEVATLEAIAGDDLVALEGEVLLRLRERGRAEEAARSSAQQLQLAARRQILRYLRPEAASQEPPLGPASRR